MGRDGWGRLGRVRTRGERRRVRRMIAVGMVVVLASVVAGCSSGDDLATTETSDVPAASVPGVGSGGGATTPAGLLTLTSSAFAEGGSIPLRNACVNQGGENASPPLAWSEVPAGTETLVLVVHDPDAALPGGFTHLVTTFPTDLSRVEDGANLTGEGPMARWMGPCPPSGEHHYVFTLYAFGRGVAIDPDLDKAAVDEVASKAIGVAELTGLFAHQA